MDNSEKKKVLVLNSESDAKKKYADTLLHDKFEFVYYTGSTIDPASLIESIEPSLLLISLEWLPQERLVALSAKRSNIPVIYVMDGIIEWSYLWENDNYIKNSGTCLQPLIGDFLCVIGRSPARYLSTLGINSRIRIIGLPRLDHYDRTRSSVAFKKHRVLVATANTCALNSNQLLHVKSALRDLKAFFSLNPHIETVWRVDPPVARELGVALSGIEQPIETVLQSVTCVVTFCSTLILEAMLKDLPVSIIEYRAVPLLATTAWQIRCGEHIEPVIKEMIAPPLEKMALQRSCLDDELESGCASKRLVDVMEVALKGHIDPEYYDDEYSGPLEYSRIHSQVSLFSTTTTTLLQYELDGCYRHMKQSNEQFGDLVDGLERLWSIRVVRAILRIFGNRDLGVLKRLNRLAGRIRQ
jgi:hypothetical protein